MQYLASSKIYMDSACNFLLNALTDNSKWLGFQIIFVLANLGIVPAVIVAVIVTASVSAIFWIAIGNVLHGIFNS